MTFPWTKKPAIAVAPSPVTPFDYLGAEKAFLAAGYQILHSPFLVRRKNEKWRPLHDGELARFVRLYLEEIGRTDLWSDSLIANVLLFLRAGGN